MERIITKQSLVLFFFILSIHYESSKSQEGNSFPYLKTNIESMNRNE